MAKNRTNFRLNDTLEDSSYSKLDLYWMQNSMASFYKGFRNKKTELPKRLREAVDNQERIMDLFNLKGFQFGNWLSVEDKWNYINATIHCLYDLNKVVGFNYNIGLNNELGISFGARGSGGALAHYEPQSNIINLTRYKRQDRIVGDVDKVQRFLYTGGVGSFAHEYGHFIDSYFGTYGEQLQMFSSLTGWTITERGDLPARKDSMRETMNQIMEICYWKDREKKIPSWFYKRIKANTNSNYWICRAEIWARIFEQYVAMKLRKAGAWNIFLSQKKYGASVYMLPQELKKVEPLIDMLLKQMREYL